MDSTPANSQLYTCTACALPARAQVKAGNLMTFDMMVRDPRLYAILMIVDHLLCRHWDDPQYLLWKEDNVDIGEVKERTLEHTFAPSKVHLAAYPQTVMYSKSNWQEHKKGDTDTWEYTKQYSGEECSLAAQCDSPSAIHLWQPHIAGCLTRTKQPSRMTSYTMPLASRLQDPLQLARCWSLVHCVAQCI